MFLSFHFLFGICHTKIINSINGFYKILTVFEFTEEVMLEIASKFFPNNAKQNTRKSQNKMPEKVKSEPFVMTSNLKRKV